jgi:hypothetical protein
MEARRNFYARRQENDSAVRRAQDCQTAGHGGGAVRGCEEDRNSLLCTSGQLKETLTLEQELGRWWWRAVGPGGKLEKVLIMD